MSRERLSKNPEIVWCDHCQNDPDTRWGTPHREEPNLGLYYHSVHGRVGVSCADCYAEMDENAPTNISIIHDGPRQYNQEIIDEDSTIETEAEVSQTKRTKSTKSPFSLQAGEGTTEESRA